MTKYARIEDGAIAETSRDPRKGLLTYATMSELQALGWAEIVDTPAPPPDPDVRLSRSVEVVGGIPTVVWTATPLTPEEIAQRDTDAADQAERDQIGNALSTLDNIVDNAGTLTDQQLRAAVGYLAKAVRRIVKDSYTT